MSSYLDKLIELLGKQLSLNVSSYTDERHKVFALSVAHAVQLSASNTHADAAEEDNTAAFMGAFSGFLSTYNLLSAMDKRGQVRALWNTPKKKGASGGTDTEAWTGGDFGIAVEFEEAGVKFYRVIFCQAKNAKYDDTVGVGPLLDVRQIAKISTISESGDISQRLDDWIFKNKLGEFNPGMADFQILRMGKMQAKLSERDWVHYVIWNGRGSVPNSVDLLAVKEVMASRGTSYGEKKSLEKQSGLIPYGLSIAPSPQALQTIEFSKLLEECYDFESLKWVTLDETNLVRLIGSFNDVGTTWFVDREGGSGGLDEKLGHLNVQLEPSDDVSQTYTAHLAALVPTKAPAASIVPQTGLTSTVATTSTKLKQ